MSKEPVLAGFYPDPSVCRVGEQYYLVNSSFEYFPAVPVHRSADLLTWTPVGAVFDDPAPFRVVAQDGASGGFYAPTIRYHDGMFWVVTTSIGDVDRGHVLVRASDPGGPWDAPVFVAGAVGIDPDLVWTEDGTCWLTWKDQLGRITQAQLDPAAGELTTAPRVIWEGTGMAHPEGPHLYTRNGWWYLVIAEGGTDRGHCVTLARSRSVSGPFEAHPGNPILTHRSTSSPVQSTGHADLVEGPDGRWWAVYLATRPRGKFPRYHVNGRETFLAQVHWVNDWPVLDEDAVSVPDSDRHFVDRFDGDLLDRRWLSRNHSVGDVATPGPAGATLVASRGDRDRVSGALLAVRTTDLAWQAAARVGAGDVALSVRLDDRHWVGVERVGDRLRVRAVIGPLDQMLAERLSGPGLALALRAVPPGDEDGAAPDRIEAGFVDDSGFCAMATIDGRYFSTEVAGGFTGRVVALEALNGEAIVSAFELCPVPQVSDAVPRLRGTTAVVGP